MVLFQEMDNVLKVVEMDSTNSEDFVLLVINHVEPVKVIQLNVLIVLKVLLN